MTDNFYRKVYEAVRCIPRGKVATYGQIAMTAGSPRAARVVGTALHRNPSPGEIPCHRVVNRFGRCAPDFAFGGEEIQRQMLRDEGVLFKDDGSIDLREFLWRNEE